MLKDWEANNGADLSKRLREQYFLPQGKFVFCGFDLQLELNCLWCVTERARGQTQDFSCPLLWSLDSLTTLYSLVADFLCTLSKCQSRPDLNQDVDTPLIVLIVLFVFTPIGLGKQVQILSSMLRESGTGSKVLVVQHRQFGVPSKIQTGNVFVYTPVCAYLCSINSLLKMWSNLVRLVLKRSYLCRN